MIRFDTGTQRFDAYVRGFSNGDGFPIDGGRGYLAVAEAARTAVFSGTGWNGEGPPAGAVMAEVESAEEQEGARGTAVLGVAGDLLIKTGWSTPTRAAGEYAVEILNTRTMAAATARSSRETGQYGAVFMDLSNRSRVKPGDELRLLVRSAAGEVMSDTVRYVVTPEDAKGGCITLNAAMNFTPAFNLLLNPFPEPFTAQTRIRFQLARKGPVSLRVFDVAGRLVRTLVNQEMEAGFHEHAWNGQADGGSAASGIYFVRLEATNYSDSRRITLIR